MLLNEQSGPLCSGPGGELTHHDLVSLIFEACALSAGGPFLRLQFVNSHAHPLFCSVDSDRRAITTQDLSDTGNH